MEARRAACRVGWGIVAGTDRQSAMKLWAPRPNREVAAPCQHGVDGYPRPRSLATQPTCVHERARAHRTHGVVRRRERGDRTRCTAEAQSIQQAAATSATQILQRAIIRSRYLRRTHPRPRSSFALATRDPTERRELSVGPDL
jgi:hypothetical protein